MNLELQLSDEHDAHILKNLWPLYTHEISEFEGVAINRHGLLCEDEEVETLADLGETLNGWWEHPKSLFPYLILVDGCPAGFNLIAKHAHVPESIDADVIVYGFFVLHAFRGKGVAERAAVAGFDEHRGRWEVVTYPTHPRAIAFWRKVLGTYAPDAHTEAEMDHPWGRKVAFHFDNTLAST